MGLRSQIRLGRIGGIEIGLHFSWFIIAVLIAFSLSEQFHASNPRWDPSLVWSAAAITAVLFFVTLLLHELAHSFVAQAKGLRVRAITLFALGGVSQIESEAPDAKSEFEIAIVGPLTSVIIGVGFVALARAGGWDRHAQPTTPVLSVLLWLGYINFSLGLFNLIPAYPLDGGRVLRALIWWINKNQLKATRAASRVGQVIAVLFILWGVYQFFQAKNVGALWIAFIGWFLLDAARSSETQLELTAELRGHRVSEFMQRDCAIVDGALSIKDFVQQHVLPTGARCFIVTQNGQMAGLITPADIKKVSPDDWERMSVQTVMRRMTELRTVSPDTPALAALELMAREDINQLPVVSNGHVDGIFSRAQVMRYLQLPSDVMKHASH